MHHLEFLSDMVIEEDGTMLILVNRRIEERYSLTRCTKRGEPVENLETSNFPPEFSGNFAPCSVLSRGGRIYLVDKEGMKAVVTDVKGRFLEGYYITAEGQPKHQSPPAIESFDINPDGSLNVTLSCPCQSQAVVIPAGGKENPTFAHALPAVCNISFCVISIVGLVVSCQTVL